MTLIFGIILLALGFLLDLISLVLGMRRIEKGGPSGVPLIPLILYVIAAVFVLPLESGSERLKVSLIGLIVHLSCQIGVPIIVWYLKRLCEKLRNKH